MTETRDSPDQKRKMRMLKQRGDTMKMIDDPLLRAQLTAILQRDIDGYEWWVYREPTTGKYPQVLRALRRHTQTGQLVEVISLKERATTHA